MVERIGDAEIALTNKTVIDASAIASCLKLQYIGPRHGVNVANLEAAKERGVTVSNIPGYSTPSVAQHVFALLLELCNDAASMTELCMMATGQLQGLQLYDRPVGRTQNTTPGSSGWVRSSGDRSSRSRAGDDLIAQPDAEGDRSPRYRLEVDELFKQADVISLHCPLTEQTQGMVNAERLASMKSNAYLINTGRGPLIDEPALAEALNNGTIAGAGLDVLSTEPPSADNPLLSAKNCVITPHIAWATVASRRRLVQIAADGLRGFLDGLPVNVVS